MAVDQIDPVFLNTPQFVDERLSVQLGREVVLKVETLNPIGSFKGRGTWLLAHKLDPSLTWVCATAGNFGQGLAYAARATRAAVHVFVASDAPQEKVERMRLLGATVEVCERPRDAARDRAGREGHLLVVDGLDAAIAEGAATIAVELETAGPLDTAIIQIGDGALVSGVARWVKARTPDTQVIGVCARGAPAMARSFAAGHPISVVGEGTIASALAVTDPVPESFARVSALVDEIVLVDDNDLSSAMALIADCTGVLVEPAGAAGVAALLRHQASIPGQRVAVLLTGSAA